MIDNNALPVFGLILARESNKYILHCLSEGVTDLSHLEEFTYIPKDIFQHLALDFKNQDVAVELPEHAEDIDDYCMLDPNELARINIIRDCEYHYIRYVI